MRVLGIDPGLRNLGWGVVDVLGPKITHIADGVCKSRSVQKALVLQCPSTRSVQKALVLQCPSSKSIQKALVYGAKKVILCFRLVLHLGLGKKSYHLFLSGFKIRARKTDPAIHRFWGRFTNTG